MYGLFIQFIEYDLLRFMFRITVLLKLKSKTSVMIAIGFHLFPFRTEKLNLSAPKILASSGKIGRRRGFAF